MDVNILNKSFRNKNPNLICSLEPRIRYNRVFDYNSNSSDFRGGSVLGYPRPIGVPVQGDAGRVVADDLAGLDAQPHLLARDSLSNGHGSQAFAMVITNG